MPPASFERVSEGGIRIGMDLDRSGAFAQHDGETSFEIVAVGD
jgi:hypothetical protein